MALKVWHLSKPSIRYIPNGIEPREHFRTRLDELDLNLPPGRPLHRLGRCDPAGEKSAAAVARLRTAEARSRRCLSWAKDRTWRRRARRPKVCPIGQSVRFLGRREDVRDILMQCDILALSSDTEQMPLVVLEAMDAGLAVASTDVGDVKYMVCEENRPYIVQGSAHELGAAMRTLVADCSVRRTIGVGKPKAFAPGLCGTGHDRRLWALFRETAERVNKGLKSCA